MSPLQESHVEDATLGWFAELGYTIGHGPEMAPGGPAAERESFNARCWWSPMACRRASVR
jgi:type I restriction enzyme R subunit